MYIYIFLKNIQKKFQDFQIFPKKKREKFSKKKKSLWTRGIEPLSHLKKKKILWTKGIGLPSDFFKKRPFFFFFQRFQDSLKSSFQNDT